MFHFKSIKTKILFLCLFAIFFTAATLVLVVFVEKTPLKKNIDEELNQLARSETSKIAHDIYLMCRTYNDLLQKKLEGNLASARFVLEQAGPPSLGPNTVSWNSVNLYTQAAKSIHLPPLRLGDKEIRPGENVPEIQKIIDSIQSMTGFSCALFQKINESGDLLCILGKESETRGVGVLLPALAANGTLNPAVNAILNGNQYVGRMMMGNEWTFTAFEPLSDSAHNILGALFIGLPEKNMPGLYQSIMETQVGKTGYVYVIRGSGDQKGNYAISKNGERDGENIWNAKDSNGHFFIQSIVQKGLALKNGSADFEMYSWKNEGEDQARTKIAAITYFEPWDWVIGAGTYLDDFQDTQIRVDRSISRMVFSTFLIAMLLLAVFGVIAYLFSGKITTPLQEATLFAQKVANGDLSQRLEIRQQDETGQLGNALNDMVIKLNEISNTLTLVAQGDLTQTVNQNGDLADAVNKMRGDLNDIMMQIQSAAGQVASSSEQLSASAQNLSSSTTEQSSALEETSASIEQLASSVEQNALNSRDANDIISKAAQNTEAGGRAVMETVDAMRKIAQTIAIVNDIADQTNLLALNAAIEAARAGDMGKGFAVVAVEVRKLAERAQQAAKEISELASHSVVRAESAGDLIQHIVPDIQRTAKLMEEINMTCQEQTSGANQIRQAIVSLDQVTQQNSTSSEETATASEELDSQAQILQKLVTRFKIDMSSTASWDESLEENNIRREEIRTNRRLLKNVVDSSSHAEPISRNRLIPRYVDPIKTYVPDRNSAKSENEFQEF